MNAEKDYYSCLGVLPSAEDVVIRAAYRALAQRYHPDRFQGDPAEVMRRMQEINEAYEVLSDSVKRRQYDEARNRRTSADELDSEEAEVRSAFEDAQRDLETSWRTAVEYFPDIERIVGRLRRTSYKLGFAFQTTLLATKGFDHREALAVELENNFLRTYFGTNPAIIAFAKELIETGERAAARELNKAVSVLGGGIDPSRVISRIEEKHGISKRRALKATVELAGRVMEYGYVDDAIELLERLGAELGVETAEKWFFGIPKKETRTVRLRGVTKQFDEDFMLADWVKNEIAPKVIEGSKR